MTIVTINYADQDVEVIAGADAWVSGVSTSRRLNGHLYNGTRADQDEIRWSRYFPKSGTYRVKVVHVTASNSGIVRLGINGVNGTKNTTNILNDDDWYSGSGIQNVESFSTVEIARGFNYINHLTNGKNASSSHYYTYYQFVEFTLINEHPVLGEATASPRNGMELLASVDLSGGASTSLSTGTFTAKKYLWVQIFSKKASAGGIQPSLKVGTGGTIATGSPYAFRWSNDGAADPTPSVNLAMCPIAWLGANVHFSNTFIINNSANEKLFINHSVANVTAGAGTSPQRVESVGKFANTSGQINIIDLYDWDSASLGTETIMKVWGMD